MNFLNLPRLGRDCQNKELFEFNHLEPNGPVLHEFEAEVLVEGIFSKGIKLGREVVDHEEVLQVLWIELSNVVTLLNDLIGSKVNVAGQNLELI